MSIIIIILIRSLCDPGSIQLEVPNERQTSHTLMSSNSPTIDIVCPFQQIATFSMIAHDKKSLGDTRCIYQPSGTWVRSSKELLESTVTMELCSGCLLVTWTDTSCLAIISSTTWHRIWSHCPWTTPSIARDVVHGRILWIFLWKSMQAMTMKCEFSLSCLM